MNSFPPLVLVSLSLSHISSLLKTSITSSFFFYIVIIIIFEHLFTHIFFLLYFIKFYYYFLKNSPSVSSLCWDVARDTILIGTRGAEIYEISASDGSDQHGGPIVQGHCEHELWGISVHPSKSQVCTVGDDRTVRVWDTASKQLLKMTRLDTAARSCAYSPDGMTIAVGLGAPEDSGVARSKKDGALVVLNEEDLTVIFETRDTKVSINIKKRMEHVINVAFQSLLLLLSFHNVFDCLFPRISF